MSSADFHLDHSHGSPDALGGISGPTPAPPKVSVRQGKIHIVNPDGTTKELYLRYTPPGSSSKTTVITNEELLYKLKGALERHFQAKVTSKGSTLRADLQSKDTKKLITLQAADFDLTDHIPDHGVPTPSGPSVAATVAGASLVSASGTVTTLPRSELHDLLEGIHKQIALRHEVDAALDRAAKGENGKGKKYTPGEKAAAAQAIREELHLRLLSEMSGDQDGANAMRGERTLEDLMQARPGYEALFAVLKEIENEAKPEEIEAAKRKGTVRVPARVPFFGGRKITLPFSKNRVKDCTETFSFFVQNYQRTPVVHQIGDRVIMQRFVKGGAVDDKGHVTFHQDAAFASEASKPKVAFKTPQIGQHAVNLGSSVSVGPSGDVEVIDIRSARTNTLPQVRELLQHAAELHAQEKPGVRKGFYQNPGGSWSFRHDITSLMDHTWLKSGLAGTEDERSYLEGVVRSIDAFGRLPEGERQIQVMIDGRLETVTMEKPLFHHQIFSTFVQGHGTSMENLTEIGQNASDRMNFVGNQQMFYRLMAKTPVVDRPIEHEALKLNSAEFTSHIQRKDAEVFSKALSLSRRMGLPTPEMGSPPKGLLDPNELTAGKNGVTADDLREYRQLFNECERLNDIRILKMQAMELNAKLVSIRPLEDGSYLDERGLLDLDKIPLSLLMSGAGAYGLLSESQRTLERLLGDAYGNYMRQTALILLKKQYRLELQIADKKREIGDVPAREQLIALEALQRELNTTIAIYANTFRKAPPRVWLPPEPGLALGAKPRVLYERSAQALIKMLSDPKTAKEFALTPRLDEQLHARDLQELHIITCENLELSDSEQCKSGSERTGVVAGSKHARYACRVQERVRDGMLVSVDTGRQFMPAIFQDDPALIPGTPEHRELVRYKLQNRQALARFVVPLTLENKGKYGLRINEGMRKWGVVGFGEAINPVINKDLILEEDLEVVRSIFIEDFGEVEGARQFEAVFGKTPKPDITGLSYDDIRKKGKYQYKGKLTNGLEVYGKFEKSEVEKLKKVGKKNLTPENIADVNVAFRNLLVKQLHVPEDLLGSEDQQLLNKGLQLDISLARLRLDDPAGAGAKSRFEVLEEMLSNPNLDANLRALFQGKTLEQQKVLINLLKYALHSIYNLQQERRTIAVNTALIRHREEAMHAASAEAIRAASLRSPEVHVPAHSTRCSSSFAIPPPAAFAGTMADLGSSTTPSASSSATAGC